MRRALTTFSDRLDGVIKALNFVALTLLVGVVFLQVVARYIFDSPPSWTEELARYAMIWAGLLGATMSFKRRFDPALANEPRGRSTGLAFAAAALRSAAVLIYLLPILWFSFFGANMNLERGFLLRHSRILADSLDISTFWVAIAVPLMIVVILVHLLCRWFGAQSSD